MMRRATTLLLAVPGALILAGWVVASGDAPASPPAGRAQPPPPEPLPEIAAIDREIDRLAERMAATTDARTPVRDPFEFAPRIDAASFVTEPSTQPGEGMSIAVAVEPAVAWPALVAILASDESTALRAVLEDARGIVRIRSADESIGDVTIEAVERDGVMLRHAPTGHTRRVALD